MIIALVGNQNCGKTALFNQLTGAKQRVGNFPGVTVEKKHGAVRLASSASVVDLPGIYSMTPYTGEEKVTRDFLLNEKPDGIINIIDATNIERNLYLTLQLLELGIPVVLALNMMDELQNNGGSIRLAELIAELGVPAVPICAIRNEGVDELVRQTIATVEAKTRPHKVDFCESGAVHRCIHGISHLIEDHAQKQGVPERFAAVKLVEGDELMLETLCLDENEIELLDHAVKEMETELDTDREAALVDSRYQFIEGVCEKCVVKAKESREYKRRVKFDSVLTHRIWAVPSFLGIILVVFMLTFGVIGAPLSALFKEGIEIFSGFAGHALENYGMNPVIRSLIIEGIFTGVGAVLSFVPIIVTLFFFLSVLEDSGYMARVAFVMDKPLRKIGLSGRSFVPMLMGFGCTVPACMATRTLASERDRKMTIFLTPFMSCSAKLPIYALFTAAFFPKYAPFVMMSLYITGIALGILSGFIMKKTVFKGAPVPFVMELPNYRFPSAKTVFRLVWDKAEDFIKRAFTVILMATICIWFLQSFDIRLNPAADGTDSILAVIGQSISVLFKPLGFSDWRASTALITGFAAKETVISTLAVLTGGSISGLGDMLHTLFSSLSAFSYLIFILLYTPCVAAIATVKRELGSLKGTFLIILYQTGIAWVAAFIVYQVGRLII
ncbi:MAG: ferrous iron transport protein B [Oscillospiraceae bacterium]|nr:ferrous iron transport protein B [Oscillospiraceae bacterium]